MRQLLFSGFNAFGQHNSINTDRTSGRVAAFAEVSVPGTDNEDAIIALNWRYTAYAVGKKLLLQGLLDSTPCESVEVEAPVEITALAAGDVHCLVLLQNGELFKLAAKPKASLLLIKLETPTSSCTGTKRTIFGTTKATKVVTSNISHIACGSHINVAISDSNVVYSIPSCLHQFPQRQWRVIQLECGHEHALLLNGNGDVYTWGNGLRGQLGHELLGAEESPVLVEALAGIKITHIAAGGWHSAAISAFGDLYTWGFNCNGQLGMRVMKPDGLLKEPTVYPLPQLHDLLECCGAANETDECAPVEVFAGARHTLLKRSCGRLWASGWCTHGQLGQQSSKLVYLDTFQALQDVPKGNVSNVICGPWATLIVLSRQSCC